MLAIACGVGAALVFATVTLCNTRSSRLIGPRAVLGGVMAVGLVVLSPLALAGGVPSGLEGRAVWWMAVAGVGDVVGLLLAYAGLQVGKVGIVAPIVATQGAVAAVISVAAGERLACGAALLLALVVAGVVLAGTQRGTPGGHPKRATGFAVGAAAAIGVSLYAIGQVSAALPVVWALLPSRIVGVLVIAVPLGLRGQLSITRAALPFVLIAGVGEVAGFGLFAIGSRAGLAVTAVLSSLFAAIAAVGARVLFGERLTRVQVVGVGVVVAAVSALSGMQATA